MSFTLKSTGLPNDIVVSPYSPVVADSKKVAVPTPVEIFSIPVIGLIRMSPVLNISSFTGVLGAFLITVMCSKLAYTTSFP